MPSVDVSAFAPLHVLSLVLSRWLSLETYSLFGEGRGWVVFQISLLPLFFLALSLSSHAPLPPSLPPSPPEFPLFIAICRICVVYVWAGCKEARRRSSPPPPLTLSLLSVPLLPLDPGDASAERRGSRVVHLRAEKKGASMRSGGADPESNPERPGRHGGRKEMATRSGARTPVTASYDWREAGGSEVRGTSGSELRKRGAKGRSRWKEGVWVNRTVGRSGRWDARRGRGGKSAQLKEEADCWR